ncbi:hypothetical protein CEV34_4833 [Brucella pseudogrignonensis]|uniref:Uncharacterized protein n=1 Tax=Brucella pseudogrignonensis TaxID=419475 RepID=A0A256G3J5_9HYPH|nr:hypothetical protein CEV34_4833 [Brucella pseudogrignonensis]
MKTIAANATTTGTAMHKTRRTAPKISPIKLFDTCLMPQSYQQRP